MVLVISGLVLCRSGSDALAGTYTTGFPLAENPISETNNWVNGKTTGLDWADVATTDGLAHGTQADPGGFDDSTAVLTGSWGPNQTATAKVFSTNQNGNIEEEVEIRLHSTITPHSCTGYEILFQCAVGGYITIARWNGALNDFTYLQQYANVNGYNGLTNGAVVSASITNGVITGYLNGVPIIRATDNTFTNGNPGMGFWLDGASPSVETDYGFTSFTATDGLTSPPVAGFVGGPTSGIAPLTVAFTNLSSGATNYAWAFGDGGTSSSANPSNTYTNPGAYSVSLTAIGPGGTNKLTLSNYIAVAAPPPFLSALIANGQFSLFFETVGGQSYTIQQDTNLVTTNWIPLTNFTGAGGGYQLSLPITNTQPGSFFRVRQP